MGDEISRSITEHVKSHNPGLLLHITKVLFQELLFDRFIIN